MNFIFLLFLAVSTPGFTQEVEDEKALLRQLNALGKDYHDSIYYELFKLYRVSDASKSVFYAKKSFEIAQENNNYYRMAKACRALAFAFSSTNETELSRMYYLKGIEIAKKSNFKELQMYMLNGLGNLFERQDFYDSALRYYSISLEVATELKSEGDQAIALNNIGLVFYNLRNFDEALRNLSEALAIKEKHNITAGLQLNLMNIAIIYNDQGKYNQAIDFLNQVKKHCNNGCDPGIEADYYYGLGYSYFRKGDLDIALPYFVKCFEMAKELGNKKIMGNTLYFFSQFKLERQDFIGALSDLQESEKLAEEINLRRLKRDIYDSYVIIYQALGDLDMVVKYQNKYMGIKDSIFNEQMASNLKEIQLDAQRKQSEVIIQQKDVEIERVRLITGLVGVIALLMIVLSFLIYRNYRASHRMKLVLEKEVESRTGELVKSNQELTKMTHEYDQLVYRASHDIRGPLATLMGLTNIAKQDTKEPLRVRDYLSKIESTANGLNQTLSQLMETNRIRNFPIVVEEVTLDSLVETIYGSFKNLNHFPLISLRTEKGDWKKPLRSDKNLINFVLTKLLDNAFRYFSVNKLEKYIKVSWSQDEHNTTIMVEDNGSGIDSQAKEKIFQLFYVASDVHGSGLGLFLAQMAAQRLGGRIVLARSSDPTIFKLVISTNLDEARAADNPLMAVS